jgi:hypothetical protein
LALEIKVGETKMKKSDRLWLAGFALFWLSFVIAFLVDYLGIVEANDLGFFETIWISWIMWTVVLGLTLAILTRFIVKE